MVRRVVGRKSLVGDIGESPVRIHVYPPTAPAECTAQETASCVAIEVYHRPARKRPREDGPELCAQRTRDSAADDGITSVEEGGCAARGWNGQGSLHIPIDRDRVVEAVMCSKDAGGWLLETWLEAGDDGALNQLPSEGSVDDLRNSFIEINYNIIR